MITSEYVSINILSFVYNLLRFASFKKMIALNLQLKGGDLFQRTFAPDTFSAVQLLLYLIWMGIYCIHVIRRVQLCRYERDTELVCLKTLHYVSNMHFLLEMVHIFINITIKNDKLIKRQNAFIMQNT